MWQEGREWGRRVMSATVKQRKTGVRRVTLPQRLKQPMK
jgi:hypothetical protein